MHIYTALQGGLVLWCPLPPVVVVIICSKCPLTITGRRYRLPEEVIVPPFVQKASGEQAKLSKQPQAPV